MKQATIIYICLVMTLLADTHSAHAEALQPDPATSATVQQHDSENDTSWPGSFSVAAINTRFAIGGFVRLDAIYDTDAIVTPCEFVTSAIVTGGGTPAEGSDGRLSFCVNATRFQLESRTELGSRELRTFIAMDFFGDESKPVPRIREGYGELRNALLGIDMLIGQTWTTFSNIAVWPDIVDFEGPNSSIAGRLPLIRFSRQLGLGFSAALAAEAPSVRHIEGDVDALMRWPDGVMALKWTHPFGHLNVAGIVRDLRVSYNDGPAPAATGWGVSGSGIVTFPWLGGKDNVVFQVNYGKGIGSRFDDFAPDAVFDPASLRLEVIPVFGSYVGVEHYWARWLSSTVVIGTLRVSNSDVQRDDAMRMTRYFTANLIWRPFDPLMFGFEFLRGQRIDKDDASGTVNRFQLMSQFTF